MPQVECHVGNGRVKDYSRRLCCHSMAFSCKPPEPNVTVSIFRQLKFLKATDGGPLKSADHVLDCCVQERFPYDAGFFGG